MSCYDFFKNARRRYSWLRLPASYGTLKADAVLIIQRFHDPKDHNKNGRFRGYSIHRSLPADIILRQKEFKGINSLL
jgi:hypothetical protein